MPEEKIVDGVVVPPAPGATPELGEDGKPVVPPEKKEEGADQPLDHEDELDKVQKKGRVYTPKEKAEYNLKKIADEVRKHGGDPAELLGVDPTDPDAVADIAEEAGRKGAAKVLQDDKKRELDKKLRSRARTPAEADLVRHHLENSIVPSGDPDEDLDNAFALANKKAIARRPDEIKRAEGAGKGTGDGEGGGGGQPPPPEHKPMPKLSAEDQKFIKRYGMVWDGKEGKFVTPKK